MNHTAHQRIEEFLILHHQHQQQKQHMLKSTTTTQQQQQRRKSLLPAAAATKCIGCGSAEGTQFIWKAHEYCAVCNNIENPCDLHIQIRKGREVFIDRHIQQLTYTIDNLKQEIILQKNIMLFQLAPEKMVVSAFDANMKKMQKKENELRATTTSQNQDSAANNNDDEKHDILLNLRRDKDIKSAMDTYVDVYLPLLQQQQHNQTSRNKISDIEVVEAPKVINFSLLPKG